MHYLTVFNLLLYEKSTIYVVIEKKKKNKEMIMFIIDNLAIITSKNHISSVISDIMIFSMLSVVVSLKK